MMLVEVVGGLVVLLLAGDLLVRGSVALARHTEVSPVVIGLTVVAFGTSAPELFASLGAVLSGHEEMSLGNVVGSNIANVLLVLGLPALIMPTTATRNPVGVDTNWMLGASAMFVGLCWMAPIGATQGFFLLALLAGMLGHSVWRARRSGGDAAAAEELERIPNLPTTRAGIVLSIALGLAGLPVGAYLLVDGGVKLAAVLGVTDGVIGLTVVALGTSLPELATNLVAALRRHADVAIGNVLGSNLFNILGIMGMVGVVANPPVFVSTRFLEVDLPVMLAAAAVLAVIAYRGGAVSRAAGVALVVCYLLYMGFLFALPGGIH